MSISSSAIMTSDPRSHRAAISFETMPAKPTVFPSTVSRIAPASLASQGSPPRFHSRTGMPTLSQTNSTTPLRRRNRVSVSPLPSSRTMPSRSCSRGPASSRSKTRPCSKKPSVRSPWLRFVWAAFKSPGSSERRITPWVVDRGLSSTIGFPGHRGCEPTNSSVSASIKLQVMTSINPAATVARRARSMSSQFGFR